MRRSTIAALALSLWGAGAAAEDRGWMPPTLSVECPSGPFSCQPLEVGQ